VSSVISALVIIQVLVLCVQRIKEGPVEPVGKTGPQCPQGITDITGAKSEVGNVNVVTKLIIVNPIG
jgi:hypothetical protein